MAHSKRTPENAEAILGHLRDGCTHSLAYQQVGIGKDTFYSWMREDSDFSDAVKKAEAECLASCVVSITKSDQWTAKAWMLERRRPDEFSQVHQIEKVVAKVLKANGLFPAYAAGDGDQSGAPAAETSKED